MWLTMLLNKFDTVLQIITLQSRLVNVHFKKIIKLTFNQANVDLHQNDKKDITCCHLFTTFHFHMNQSHFNKKIQF